MDEFVEFVYRVQAALLAGPRAAWGVLICPTPDSTPAVDPCEIIQLKLGMNDYQRLS